MAVPPTTSVNSADLFACGDESLSHYLVIALVLCAIGLLGCRGKRAQCPAAFDVDATGLLAQHDQARAGIRSLKAEARVEQWGKRTRIRGTVFLFLQTPDHVRFDVMSQLGPVSVLTSDGSRFQLLDQRARRFVEGPTCADNIGRLLGIALEPAEVFRLLTGGVPRLVSVSQELGCEGGDLVVKRGLSDGATQRIVFAPVEPGAVPRLKRVEVIDAAGKKRWRVELGDYRSFETDAEKPISLPRVVRFYDSVRKTDTEIRLKALDVNAEVPPDAFQQVVPGGIEVEHAPCD